MSKPYRSDISTNSLRTLRTGIGALKFKDVFILSTYHRTTLITQGTIAHAFSNKRDNDKT